jgi:hypothetical protein
LRGFKAFKRGGCQHLFHLFAGLAALGTVGLINNHGIAAVRQVFGCIQDKGKFLQGGDDQRNAALQGLGKLGTALVDPLHHPGFMLKLIDRALQLLIKHPAVSNNNHRVKDALIRRIMQACQPIGQPGNGIALA